LSSKADAYKKNEREMWDQFSRRYTEVVLPEFRPFGRRLIKLAGIRSGMWVLDVATGPGEPALTIARRVGPRGLVAGVDFSPTMLRRARARARALGVRNVQFHEMDAERLTFADLTFDRVVCRFGLMLMPAAERALAEMHRVLVPGGRIGVAVWSAQSKVNTLGIVRRALERHDAFHPPAGFRHVRSERVTAEWVFNSPEEFWNSMKQGPSLRRALAAVSPAGRRAVRADVLCALAKYERNGRLRIPNEAVLALGVK
jgi:enediyne biosynthesis protein CalE5